MPASAVGAAPGALALDAAQATPGKASAPRMTVKSTPAGPVAEITLTAGAVGALGGSADDDFNATILVETLLCVRPPTERDGEAARLAAVAAALAAFKPKDEIEGMLAAQATALHFTSMECLRRAMLPNQPPDIASRLRKDGTNLARGMTDMLEALDRKRGKGPQVVRVERVVVQDGGQAIVGTVAAGAGVHGRGEG